MSIKLGDRGPTVRQWRGVMSKRFAGYARIHGDLPLDTDLFGARAQAWQKEYQVRTGQAAHYGAANGIVSDHDLEGLGIKLPGPSRAKPVLFTVEGHMSDMFVGPCAETARILEQQGVCRWQPVGYNNTAMPFDNQSGVQELARLLNDKSLLPPGTPWGMAIFSQGGIVGSRFFMEQIRSGPLNWRLKDFRGCLAHGNPYRENGVVAEWIPDPPRAGTQGISDVRMTNTPASWKEVARTGDLYTENTTDAAGLNKTAIYKIVAEGSFFGGPAAILTRVLAILGNIPLEMIPVVMSIISGVMFLANMEPHGGYDLGPGIEHMRRVLTT